MLQQNPPVHIGGCRLIQVVLYRTVVVVEVIEFINLAAAVSHCTVLLPLVVCSLEM